MHVWTDQPTAETHGSMTQTQKAVTAHGEVEYDVVECASCGNDVAKEEAERFVMVHDLKKKTDWHDHTEYEMYHHTEGWACQYCRDDPSGFPTPTLKVDTEELTIATALICLTLLMVLGAIL